jgi:hypothetical protein
MAHDMDGFKDPLSALAAWVVNKTTEWEDHRNTNYESRWDEYYRIWRGLWDASDKTRQSEQSRLIAPATQQAIESTVAELEEAVFGRDEWFDIQDDIMDQNPTDAMVIKKVLKEDLERCKIKDSVSECLLNAAIYGTGIGKINIEEKIEKVMSEFQIPQTYTTDVAVSEKVVPSITLDPLTPKQFVIDPSATSIDNALGVAQIVVKPKYEITEGMKEGIYESKPLGDFQKINFNFDEENDAAEDVEDKVKITEYWGRIPKKYLVKDVNEAEDFDYEDDDLVEAVVVIANDNVVLKAEENPYLMEDRPFIAFQLDRVPNKFWGRGVAEKGYNPQKALDAELRARIDALALTTHPMMGVDATRLPRGVKFEVKAGKTILTNGDPRQTLMPLNFGQVANSTFTEAAELERMVQMGTGAMDSANSNYSNPRNSTASGMSMIQAASIKRQKRTIMNFTENFLVPLIEKATWRYIQFSPDRYPAGDYKFKAYSSMGIMAKEIEMMQMIQLLSMTQPGTMPHGILLMAIFENSSMSNRGQMQQAIAQSMQSDPQELQLTNMVKQLELQKLMLELEEMKAGTVKDYAQAAKYQADAQENGSEAAMAKIQIDLAEKMAKIEKLRSEAQNMQSETARNIPEVEHLQSETILNLAKASKERMG